MSFSQVSLPSPRPFHWDSPEETIRLVTSSTTPESDSQYALDYFESAGRRFSYRLGPSAFESLDSIAVRSAENHTDDERGSVDDCSLTSEGSLVRSDTVSSFVDTCLFVDQRHNMSSVANEPANGIAATQDMADTSALYSHSTTALARERIISSVENSAIFANTLERQRFIALLREPTASYESIDGITGSVEALSVLGFFNSTPCPPESSLGRSSSGSSVTELTEPSTGSSERSGARSVADSEEISIEEIIAQISAFKYPVKVERPSAMEFGSFADWSRDPKYKIRENQELVKSQEEQKKKKGLFNRARSLLKLFRWRK